MQHRWIFFATFCCAVMWGGVGWCGMVWDGVGCGVRVVDMQVV